MDSLCPCCLSVLSYSYLSTQLFHPQDQGEVPVRAQGEAGAAGPANCAHLGNVDAGALACVWEGFLFRS